jgi:glycosyltransferase involved in cell wall biosynthesis
MQITFLLPHVRLSGGVKVMLEYANRFYGMGHDVHIILPAKQYKWYRLDKKVKSLGKKSEILSPESVDWFNNLIPIKILPQNHAKLIPPADVLIATAWQTAEFASRLPPETGEKIYFIQHHEILWTREKEKAEKTYHLPFKKITVSTWLKEILWEKYQQKAQVLVVPVDREHFFCGEKVWNTPPRVCLLHHDYSWKGYKEGIAAIRRVKSQNRAIDLVVFGEKVKDPRGLYEEAGFEFEYHFRPTGEKLREIYSSCDIFLCPSWFEGLGLPGMEAMACRSALVTTDTGGCRDYAIHGETALVSPPKDIDALADNLTALIDDKQLMIRLSENGEKKIREFDWETNCQRLLDLFESH